VRYVAWAEDSGNGDVILHFLIEEGTISRQSFEEAATRQGFSSLVWGSCLTEESTPTVFLGSLRRSKRMTWVEAEARIDRDVELNGERLIHMSGLTKNELLRG
jgi:hypothetical protein